jgi:hypothetical protein
MLTPAPEGKYGHDSDSEVAVYKMESFENRFRNLRVWEVAAEKMENVVNGTK